MKYVKKGRLCHFTPENLVFIKYYNINSNIKVKIWSSTYIIYRLIINNNNTVLFPDC